MKREAGGGVQKKQEVGPHFPGICYLVHGLGEGPPGSPVPGVLLNFSSSLPGGCVADPLALLPFLSALQ